MLNIPVLTERWGKTFGVMNEIDTMRGVRIFELADLINALFPNAAEQRLVVDTLYERTESADNAMNDIVAYYILLAKNTLIQMCLDDGLTIPVDGSDTIVLNKLVMDMMAQAKTFKRPTASINTTILMATGTPITTPQGPPTGNGIIIGSIANPRLGSTFAKNHIYAEQFKFVCSSDSYKSGIQQGQEVFDVTSKSFVTYSDSDWPRGSGINSKQGSLPTSNSTLIKNAYFDSWDDTNPNTPQDWVLNNLIPGTTILRSVDPYTKDYAVELRGALIGAELRQEVNGLQGTTSYIAAFRYKRPAVTTAGVVTIALTDTNGVVMNDAAGVPISKTLAVTGAAGNYTLQSHVFTVPKGYTQPVFLSIKVTTAFAAGEKLLLDNVEFIQMVEAYPDGPAFGFIPGNIGWAINDTYTFDVANTGNKTTFVGNLERVYQIMSLGIDVPTSLAPTEADTLINVTP